MDSAAEVIFRQMLDTPAELNLPPRLVKRYGRARHMLDRIGGGAFRPQELVVLAIASGAGLDPPKPLSPPEEEKPEE